MFDHVLYAGEGVGVGDNIIPFILCGMTAEYIKKVLYRDKSE